MLIPKALWPHWTAPKQTGTGCFFLCTGRNHRMTEPLLRHSCFAGAVCSAGGYVLCDGKTLVDIPMEPQQAEGVRAAPGTQWRGVHAGSPGCHLWRKQDG